MKPLFRDRANKNKLLVVIILLSNLLLYGLVSYFSVDSGKVAIGGDFIIPLHPSAVLQKSLFFWSEDNFGNPSYLPSSIPLMLYYKVSNVFLDLAGTQRLLYFLFLLVSLTGWFLIYNYYFPFKQNPNKDLIYIFFINFFYCFSPVRYILPNWHMGYFFLPLVYFFAVSYWSSKNSLNFYLLLLSLSIIPFSFSDMPQYKMFLLYFLFVILTIFLTKEKTEDKKKIFLKANCWILFTFLVSAWYLLPYGYIILNDIETIIKQVPISYTPKLLEFGHSTLLRMFRLYHNAPFFPSYYSGKVTHSPIFILTSYLLPFLIFLSLLRIKNIKAKFFMFFILFFLFLTKGSNEPFGFIYTSLLKKSILFRAFRTTSNISIFTSFFYAISIAFIFRQNRPVFKNCGNKIINFLLVLVVLINSIPILLSFQTLNMDNVIKDADIHAHGIEIPEIYFKVSEKLEKTREYRTLLLPLRTYSKLEWGYFGPSLLPFLTEKGLVYSAALSYGSSGLSIGEIINEGNIEEEKLAFLGIDSIIYEKIKNDQFVLHDILEKKDIIDYKPYPLVFAVKDLNSLYNSRSLESINFYRFNPTTYFIEGDNFNEDVYLVLIQNFTTGWKVYKNKQADLYDDKTNNILEEMSIVRYLFEKPLSEELHFKANLFENAWFLRKDFLAEARDNGILIIYYPQILFYFGAIISVGSILSLVLFNIYRNKKVLSAFSKVFL